MTCDLELPLVIAAGTDETRMTGTTTKSEEQHMAAVEIGSFDSPEEIRKFEGNGQSAFVTVAGATVGKATFEPGWKWSDNVKPIAGTDSCQVSHLAYVVSGRMAIQMDDGSEAEVGPNQAVAIPPGHDAVVIGDEPCVMVDFGEISEYAKPS